MSNIEDQTLNPFRAPKAGPKPPRRPAVEPDPARPLSLFRELPITIALVAIILIAYWGVWKFEFVYFDDPGYVTDNLDVQRGLPLFTDFNAFCVSVRWAFTAFVQSNWHPLTWLSHMLDVQIYGLEAGGHHVTNIIFHSLNTVLLFWLLRWLTGRSWCSAAVAALFAVHPMHVESVVWIAERKDVLSTFLGLSTLLAYVRYAKNPGVTRYIPVFVLLALGLLAKPMLVTLPCVCLLLDFWPLGRLKLSEEGDSPAPRPAADRPAVPRRKAKRNQRLPAAARTVRAPQFRPQWQGTFGQQFIRLLLEKIPLFVLSGLSMAITPYAQAHGGSMASADELEVSFRIENSLQSYLTYIQRMFWPGKMSVLYLLDKDHVNHFYTAAAVVVMAVITVGVVYAAFRGRKYLAVGWFWYVGTLVPVIGIVQVGEQSHADRYTYIPYIGLFIMLAWGIADLVGWLTQFGKAVRFGIGLAMALVLTTCVGWTKYQLQYWTDVETHLRHALTITPDNWNMLNNLGVKLWKKGQEEESAAGKAEAEGKVESSKEHHLKALAFKKDAMDQWIHGITARPTATDIHSNLGYAYSEANDLDKAEWHLNEAVRLKPISPRPRNNLGRVLLRRSQQLEGQAREANAAEPQAKELEAKANEVEAKAKNDPAEADKARKMRAQAAELRAKAPELLAKVPEWKAQAKMKLDAAIAQFQEAINLDPTLLEARLNLGEVYIQLNELDKAEEQYREIVRLDSPNVKDLETLNNFSQGWFCLARIAIIRKNSDEAVADLERALQRNPKNFNALQTLALQRYLRGEFREGNACLWPLLAGLPPKLRWDSVGQFANQFASAGKLKEAVQAWNFLGWAMATSPEPQILNPEGAAEFAQRAVAATKQQDPLSLDTLAAAAAAKGQYAQAAQIAQKAISLANEQGNKPLAAAISERLQFYQQGKPYRCKIDGSDRP